MPWLVDEDCPHVRRYVQKLQDDYDDVVCDLRDPVGQRWCEKHLEWCARCVDYHNEYAVDEREV